MIFDTYARRKMLRDRAAEPEVYTYDVVPDHLRHQLVMIFDASVGKYWPASSLYTTPCNANEFWEEIDRVLQKEIYSYVTALTNRDDETDERVFKYLRSSSNVDDWLSCVEILCVFLNYLKANDHAIGQRAATQKAADALKEINQRFEQHAFGYQFENRTIIRVDSRITHSEIVKPALSLLAQPVFRKADQEFMTAHTHYRSGNFKDCVTAANRAFESILKAICETQHWEYAKGDRATELVSRVSKGGLFTHDFDKGLASFIAALKTGLPTVRNDAGGHGESLTAAAVSAEIARYALNMTATNVVFLGECYHSLRREP